MKLQPQDWPVVITAAGHGTRFRPFTFTLPKEMLPIGGVPAVELVAYEAARAGATHIFLVVRPGDTVIRAHFQHVSLENTQLIFVEEDASLKYGNAAPLLACEPYLSEVESFGVAFGDDVLLQNDDLLSMHKSLHTEVSAIIAGTQVERERAVSFGVITTDERDPMRMLNLRQRPPLHEITEPLVVVSRLVLRPTIFSYLHEDWGDAEVDLGLAVGKLALSSRVLVHRIHGQWVTVGDPIHYLQAQETWQNLQQTQQKEDTYGRPSR